MTDAAAIERTVRAVPGVSGMHAGAHGTASTFTAAGRVWGIRVADDTIDVHVSAVPRIDLRTLGAAIQEAVRRTEPGYAGAVHVHIEDLVEPRSDAAPGRKQ